MILRSMSVYRFSCLHSTQGPSLTSQTLSVCQMCLWILRYPNQSHYKRVCRLSRKRSPTKREEEDGQHWRSPPQVIGTIVVFRLSRGFHSSTESLGSVQSSVVWSSCADPLGPSRKVRCHRWCLLSAQWHLNGFESQMTVTDIDIFFFCIVQTSYVLQTFKRPSYIRNLRFRFRSGNTRVRDSLGVVKASGRGFRLDHLLCNEKKITWRKK